VSHPKAILDGMDARARRRFGQNFLHDRAVVKRIVQCADLSPGQRVLEIGPGLGALTGELLATGAEVTAIERDRVLAARLADLHPDLKLVQGDALQIDWDALCPNGTWRVVANLPYNVGTPILQRLLRRADRFDRLVLMLQKEVVDRLTAQPGSKIYGGLTLHVGIYARITPLFSVSPGAFHPKPKVDSSVVRFDLREEPDTGGAPPERFHQVVKAAFASRRKTLRNNFKSAFGLEAALTMLEAAGVDPTERAERLDRATFAALAQHAPTGPTRS
jgi:16S rRNA (adenine1518-N6/adenine1519-N6)-dimethyltransferase